MVHSSAFFCTLCVTMSLLLWRLITRVHSLMAVNASLKSLKPFPLSMCYDKTMVPGSPK